MYIHLNFYDLKLPLLPCLNSTFRRTLRALTQLYEQVFSPLGLSSTQFTVLILTSYMIIRANENATRTQEPLTR